VNMEILRETRIIPPITIEPGDTIQVEYNNTMFFNMFKKKLVIVDYMLEEQDGTCIVNFAGIFKIPTGGYGGYFSTDSQLDGEES